MSDLNENVSAEPTGDIAGAPAEPMEAPESAGVADWRDSIPSDIRSSIDVESLEDLAKGYVNAQQMIGGSIRIPGKEAGQEDWNKFYDKFSNVPGLARYNPEDLSSLYDAAGRPQSAKDYKVDGAPPEFLQAAHDAGLNRAQVEAIIDFEKNTEAAYSDLEQQEIDQGINTLKQEWGHSFDRKLEEGQRAVAFLESTVPGLTEALESTGAGNHPAMVKVFQALGANLQEGAGFSGSHAESNAMTPYEAKMQIQEILNNEQHPYHEGDEAATERFLELHRYANVG